MSKKVNRISFTVLALEKSDLELGFVLIEPAVSVSLPCQPCVVAKVTLSRVAPFLSPPPLGLPGLGLGGHGLAT